MTVKLHGVQSTLGQVFIQLDNISELFVTADGAILHMANGNTYEVPGEYLMTIVQTLQDMELIPIGDAEETDVGDTDYVDETQDGLEQPVDVEVRMYDETHDDGHPELEGEQFSEIS